jgi:hypothetical protein
MTFMNIRGRIWIVTLVLALSFAGAASGQEAGSAGQEGQTGVAAPAGTGQQGTQESQSPAASADSRSFLSTEQFSPGRVGQMRSYILPSLMITGRADSNDAVGPGRQKFETYTGIVGRLTLGKIGKHSNISMDYLGGAQVYTHQSNLNGTVHQFGITGTYEGKRWGYEFDDRASYLPESSFGFGGFGYTGGLGLSLGGAVGSNLQNLSAVLDPTSGLITGRGARIMNTTAMQVQYAISPRSSISVAGSYSLLHFRTPGFFDNKSSTAFVSYSHMLSARDYIGLSYGVTLFKIQSSVPAFQSHVFQVSYGHKISGRLAMQVGGGPLLNKFTSPLTGPTTPLSWTASGSVQYRAGRGGLALSYIHYTTAGGGVLAGAATDRVYGAWSVRLTRKWSGSFGPGFSHNRNLAQYSLTNTRSTYDSFYGSASLSRSLGRHSTIFFNYEYTGERSDLTPCLAGNCGRSFLRHEIGFGFDFHPRQLVFD